MDLLINLGRQNMHAPRKPQKSGNLECLERADKDKQHDGKEGGTTQPKSDARKDLPWAGAAHRPSLLETRVHGSKRQSNQQEGNRQSLQAIDEYHVPCMVKTSNGGEDR